MDELIEYLMHTPNNTNPNVARDMLQNISGSSSEEPNIEIFEGNEYYKEELPTYVAFSEELNGIEVFQIGLIENIKKGTISNLSEKTTYVGKLSLSDEIDDEIGDGPVSDPIKRNNILFPATLKTIYPLTTEQIETFNAKGTGGYFYTFNKQVSVLYDVVNERVYLTQDQIDNDLTFIKKQDGLL